MGRSFACTRTRTWGSLPIWARFKLKLYKFCAPRHRQREKEGEREEACNNYRQRRRFMDCPLSPLPLPTCRSSALLTLRVRSTRSLKFFFGGTLHVGHTHSQGGGTPHMFSIRFDLHTNFFFSPSFVYFFLSDFCLIFFVVGASAKFMSQLENSGNICSQHISTSFLANTASTVGWVGEKDLTQSFLLQFPKVTHAQLGQVYK